MLPVTKCGSSEPAPSEHGSPRHRARPPVLPARAAVHATAREHQASLVHPSVILLPQKHVQQYISALDQPGSKKEN